MNASIIRYIHIIDEPDETRSVFGRTAFTRARDHASRRMCIMPLTKEDNVDSHISHIINRALDGTLITRDEVVDLLSVEHGTIEAAAVQIAGRRADRRAL